MNDHHLRRLGVVLAAFVFGTALLPTGAASATGGTLQISSDTTLTEDHNGPVVVTADGVTLDCAGHTITGEGLMESTGIALSGREYVAIRNCTIEGFEQDGVNVQSSHGNTFSDNTINGIRQGFVFHASGDNVVTRNTVTGAFDWFGFGFFAGSQGNRVTENTAKGATGVGFMIQDAHNHNFVNNDGSGNYGSGFRANPPAGGNYYEGNTANDNTVNGFQDNTTGGFDAGTSNLYWENHCLDNEIGGSSPAGLCSESGYFTDDDAHMFERDIEWIANEGITRGCNPPAKDWFCPDDHVTRGQMAAFLTRALGLDDQLDDPFIDDDNHIFEDDIEKLAAAGITKGCNPPANDRFCPDSNVTRGQMAAFLVRALGYTDDGGGDLFTDDDDSIFEGNIDRLGTAGVTKGCDPPTNDRYCPSGNVTRGQMAAFLHRALS